MPLRISSCSSVGRIVCSALGADDKEIAFQAVDGTEEHGVAVAANVVDQMIGTGGALTDRPAEGAFDNVLGHLFAPRLADAGTSP
jgi:hypothetical protein